MIHPGHPCQDLIRHLVHSCLHACAVVLSERSECNLSRSLPRNVEIRKLRPNITQRLENCPFPARIHLRTQYPIPGLPERGILIPYEPVEGRAGSFEDQQPLNAGADSDAGPALGGGFGVSCFGAVAEKGVRVREVVDDHAGPAVGDGLDMGDVDVGVLLDEVGGNNGGEELGWRDRVLFGKD